MLSNLHFFAVNSDPDNYQMKNGLVASKRKIHLHNYGTEEVNANLRVQINERKENIFDQHQSYSFFANENEFEKFENC